MIDIYNNEDYEAINNLGNEINPNFSKLFKINELSKNERIYVYKEEKKIFGFIHFLINIDIIEILNIVVDAKERRKGIASILLDYVLSLPDIQYNRILLEVNKNNHPAISLYKKFNFYIINERKKYYGNEDALIMERSVS